MPPLSMRPAPPVVSMGVDISTATGVAVLAPGDASPRVLATHELTGGVPKGRRPPGVVDGIRRAQAIATQVVQVAIRHHPSVVVIEGYGFASHSLATSVEIGTLVRYLLWKHSFEWFSVAPGTLKKFVAGKGQAQKDLMRLATYKRWAFEHDSDNVIDAYGLACVGLALRGRLRGLTQSMRDTIAQLSATHTEEES